MESPSKYNFLKALLRIDEKAFQECCDLFVRKDSPKAEAQRQAVDFLELKGVSPSDASQMIGFASSIIKRNTMPPVSNLAQRLVAKVEIADDDRGQFETRLEGFLAAIKEAFWVNPLDQSPKVFHEKSFCHSGFEVATIPRFEDQNGQISRIDFKIDLEIGYHQDDLHKEIHFGLSPQDLERLAQTLLKAKERIEHIIGEIGDDTDT